MQVFLTWSGPRSLKVAEILRDWLTELFEDEVGTWMSPSIEKGEEWFKEIVQRLNKADFGIACVTPENKGSEWLHFEVGYLRGRDRLVTGFLLDVEVGQLKEGPFPLLNHTKFSREDLLSLAQTLNAHIEKGGGHEHSPKHLTALFDARWPVIEPALRGVGASLRVYTDRDTLNEIYSRVVAIQRSIFGRPISSDSAMMFGADDYYAPRVASLEEMVKLVRDPQGYVEPPPLGAGPGWTRPAP